MKKRGQIIGTVITYFLIALIIILIQFIGYKAFTTIKEKQCNVELTKFEIDLKDLGKEVSYGAVEEKNYDAPCNVDEIYFIDLEKDIPLNAFDRLPIIKDSLKNKVQKNVFLVKDNKVKKLFYAGNLEFLYPYYSCLRPQADKINLFLEGAGKNGVKIIPGCTQAECTEIPIDLSDEDAERILSEFVEFGCEECPLEFDISAEIEKFEETLKKVNLYRRIRYCKDTGITTVEIIIKPKRDVTLKNFRFFELIPKECIESLNEYLAETLKEGVSFEVITKEDPLIVWQFDVIDKETVINYKLRKDLSEECRKAIEGLGIAERISEEGVELGPLSLDLHDEITLKGHQDKFKINLRRGTLGYDYDNPSKISYSIKSQSSDIVDCEIKNNQLECKANANVDGFSDVIIEVSDGVSTYEDTIRVKVEKSVENILPERDEEGVEDESSEDVDATIPVTDESEALIKFQCEENKYAHCQANCKPGDCALDFGEGWVDIDCGCCGMKNPFTRKCVGNVKPLCKRTWWTEECSTAPSCGSGRKIGEERC